MIKDYKGHFGELGFPLPLNVIMKYLGGSAAHGAQLEGKSDTDWYGVYIETPTQALGLGGFSHWVKTTGNGQGNTPEDTDVTLYSLRKWAGLAAKGNPSCLHFLFAPTAFENIWWSRIRVNTKLFIAKESHKPFFGFAQQQMQRLFGERGQKNVNRAELEEQFGYDTKYAMHVIRLYTECIELMETGQITLPRPNKGALIDIRKGKYSFPQFSFLAREFEEDAKSSVNRSQLPESIDREAISELVAKTYVDFWDFEKDKEHLR